MDPDASVVIDNGSGLCKAGLSGDDAPRSCFPSVVGISNQDVFVGEEAISQTGILSLKHRVERGLVVDWEHITKIWHHCYKNLEVAPSDRPCLLAEGSALLRQSP